MERRAYNTIKDLIIREIRRANKNIVDMINDGTDPGSQIFQDTVNRGKRLNEALEQLEQIIWSENM